jgi:NAD-dependent dihydropyrimidine dehydrogenase PreA subunit
MSAAASDPRSTIGERRSAGGRKKTSPDAPPVSLISREQLMAWLDHLAQRSTLIAPRDVSGVVLYRPVQTSGQVVIGGRPVLSVKEVFFPPTERLIRIEKTGSKIHLEETLPEGRAVVFGVRPCEGRGVRLLDALFLDQAPADPCYARRRENTTLVGLACRELGPTCFCTSVGGAPDMADNVDLMLSETGDGYIVEVITEKGGSLIVDQHLPTYDDSPRAPILNPQSSIPNPLSIPWREHFDNEFWLKMGERCLSCRACAYVCPTCRCFIVRDERPGPPGRFERLRCWDACAGENYRRIAGGHKPRPEKGERLRNRFLCKFYYYPEQVGLTGTVACVGCGRCIDVCPVGVDIIEVLLEMAK